MQKLNIDCSIVEVTKNEGKEVQRLKALIEHNREQAERSADIWMRADEVETRFKRRLEMLEQEEQQESPPCKECSCNAE